MKCFQFLFVFLLSGCGTIQPIAKINIPNLSQSEVVTIIDKRQQREKESVYFSQNPLNCAFGIERYGDDRLIPNKIRLLQHRVFEKFKSPPKIVINSFVVYHNNQEWARKTGEEMNYAKLYWGKANNPDCQPPEVLNAYFTEEENPKVWPVFIVYIDADIDNKSIRIRFPFPYLNNFSSNRSYQISAIEQAIALFLNQY